MKTINIAVKENTTINLVEVLERMAKTFNVLAKTDNAKEQWFVDALLVRSIVLTNPDKANYALSYALGVEHDAIIDSIYPDNKRGNAQFKRAFKSGIVACRYLGAHGDREIKLLAYLVERCNAMKISLDKMSDYQFEGWKKAHADNVRKADNERKKEKERIEKIENTRSLLSFTECHDLALIENANHTPVVQRTTPTAPASTTAPRVNVDGKYDLLKFQTNEDTRIKIDTFIRCNVQFNNWSQSEQAELVKQLLPTLFEGFYLDHNNTIKFGK